MRRWSLSLLLAVGCMLPMVAEAGTIEARQPSFPATSYEATGLILSTEGDLPKGVLHKISQLVARDIVSQAPLGGSLVSLRFDRKLPAASVRSRVSPFVRRFLERVSAKSSESGAGGSRSTLRSWVSARVKS